MKKIITFIMTFLLVAALAACGSSPSAAVTQAQSTQAAASVVDESSAASTASDATGSSAASTPAASTEVVLTENSDTHDEASDYTWDSAAVTAIELMGDTINASGEGVRVDGSTLTITAAGTYSLSGSLTDGQVLVDTADEAVVRLILNGVDLHSSTGAPLAVLNAEKVVIVLADGAQNFVSDADAYVFANADETEPNAAVFSKADLTIFGGGSLTVYGNYNDGIASKDGLIIAGGTITVNAIDDGIRGKDYLVVKDGTITVDAQGDGLKADNEEDAAKGYIAIEGGALTVNASGDALDAATDVIVTNGQIDLTAGGGSANIISADASAKGIKGTVSVTIDGGSFEIDSADDAVHSNGSIVVNGGSFVIATGDDGMHADATLEINGGEIQVTQSYEGIESAAITINAGTLRVFASDDGINVAGGNDGSGMNPGKRPGGGQDIFSGSADYTLDIHGGTIIVEAAGDGIDVNGAITMTDGVVIVNGPTQQMNGALDYDYGFNISGGLLVAAGSAGMAQSPDASSSQNSVMVYFAAAQPAGTLVHIQNSQGEDVLTFAPAKEFQSLAFSSPALATGETYTVYVGGNADGSVSDGLYQGGTYSSGSEFVSFTVSSPATMAGAGGGNFRRRP